MTTQIAEAAQRELLAAWEPVSKRTAIMEARPRTVILASVNPPRTLGLWEKELLIAAGGAGLANAEAHDVSAEELVAFAPEIIIIAGDNLEGLTELEGWLTLPAVTGHEVYLVEPAYLSEVGEGLAEAARVLATILHPSRFTEMLPTFSVQLAPMSLFTGEPDEEDEDDEDENANDAEQDDSNG